MGAAPAQRPAPTRVLVSTLLVCVLLAGATVAAQQQPRQNRFGLRTRQARKRLQRVHATVRRLHDGPEDPKPAESGPNFAQHKEAAAAVAAAIAAANVTQSSQCRKLLWFMCLGPGPEEAWYWEAIAVAMMSWKAQARSLQPVLVYLGSPNAYTTWFEDQGGVVLFHQSQVKSLLEAAVAQGWRESSLLLFEGMYARLELPLLLWKALERVQDAHQFDQEYILYTDTDVMFFSDVSMCSFGDLRPMKIAMGPEAFKGHIGNNGVYLLNARTAAADIPGLYRYAETRQWQFPAHDQTLLLEYYSGETEPLPDRFNWKAYWGGGGNISIVHFHGPKPFKPCTQCFLATRQVPTTPECGCPEPYTQIFQMAMAADNGNFLNDVTNQFGRFVAASGLPKHEAVAAAAAVQQQQQLAAAAAQPEAMAAAAEAA